MENQSIAGDRRASNIVSVISPKIEQLITLETPAPDAEKGKQDAEAYTKGMQALGEGQDDKVLGNDIEGAKGSEVEEHPEEIKKNPKLQERFSELTQKRKDAEAAAKTAAEQREAERVARQQAEQERDALRAKYEPPKTEIGPEPQPEDYTDAKKFAADLKEWAAEKTRFDDAKEAKTKADNERKEKAAKKWQENVNAALKEIPDYADVVGKSTVAVSQEAQQAIIEDENGTAILYHLAKNPDVAEKIAKMDVPAMNKEIGRLSERLAKKPQQTATTQLGKIAEISKAPAPITPARGNAGDPPNLFDSNGKFNGTYQEYKAAREAGRIK